METALKEAGSDMTKVLKVTAMLDNIKDYKDFNEVRRCFFPIGVHLTGIAFVFES